MIGNVTDGRRTLPRLHSTAVQHVDCCPEDHFRLHVVVVVNVVVVVVVVHHVDCCPEDHFRLHVVVVVFVVVVQHVDC